MARDTGSREAVAVVAPPGSVAPPVARAEHLVGMTGTAVEDLLGQPQFRRAEAPAQLWQYRGDLCTLDVFLYPRAAGDADEVTHVEMRPQPGVHMEAEACFRLVWQAQLARHAL